MSRALAVQLQALASQHTLPVVSETLFATFARTYEPPHWVIEDLLRKGTPELRQAIQIAVDSVTQGDLESLDHDTLAQSEVLFSGDAEMRARLFVVSQALSHTIYARRLTLAALGSAAPPYGHSALQGVVPDAEGLVPLTAFDIEGDSLCREGFSFFVLPGVPAANANYWLLNELQRTGLAESVSVRLDPLLFGPADELRGGYYRAAVYGQPLDWQRVRGLREVEHGRWAPGRLSRGHLFTDYAWVPHDREVDFLCEELPIEAEIGRRGTRYLHAVYDKDQDRISHLDGATRILTSLEFGERAAQHVRNAGKVGVRTKIFRTDEPISPETLGPIVESFFFWNYDVARYFGAPIPPDL